MTTFACTDTGNAERLIAMHGQDMRYCPELQQWLLWDGRRWKTGLPQEVARLASQVVEHLWLEVSEAEACVRKAAEKWARKSTSALACARAVKILQTMPGIPVALEDLDAYPLVLNCANGVVDLYSNRLRDARHARRMMLTKLCPVAYDPAALAPRFEAFVDRVMGGERARVESLQRAVGYALTGAVSERVIFWVFGSGSSGKTTFLELLRRLLGDYACQIDSGALDRRGGGGGIDALRGVRFAVMPEGDPRCCLPPARLQRLCGGGARLAHRKYREPVRIFRPVEKLFVDANSELPVGDPALLRRVCAVPFPVEIPAGEADPMLLEKLLQEAEGILAWAVRGCQLWMSDGLGEKRVAAEGRV